MLQPPIVPTDGCIGLASASAGSVATPFAVAVEHDRSVDQSKDEDDAAQVMLAVDDGLNEENVVRGNQIENDAASGQVVPGRTDDGRDDEKDKDDHLQHTEDQIDDGLQPVRAEKSHLDDVHEQQDRENHYPYDQHPTMVHSVSIFIPSSHLTRSK
jgi:hypothetical protein